MIRQLLHTILSPIAKVSLVQDLNGKITNDTIIIQKMSPQKSMSNSISGWDVWAVYIYTRNSPLTLDILGQKVTDLLYTNGFEITSGAGGEYYDKTLQAYVTVVTCRNPTTLL